MHAIAFNTPKSGAPGEIFGIDVAILNFARNYCRYTRQEKIYVLPDRLESFQTFLKLAEEAGIDLNRCINLQNENSHLMNDIHTLFQPDPFAINFYWHRTSIPAPGYAVCSLTHTMTGSDSCTVVSDYLTAPTQIGDALICPSRAIKQSISNLFDLYGDYLSHRFGVPSDNKITCPVDLPIIPLAIETQKYIDRAAPDKRTSQRAALNITDDEVVILNFGRQSYYTKGHPLPTMLAAERAAIRLQEQGIKVRLIMMGFFSPPHLEAEYKALAADICQTAKVDFIDKDDERFPDGLWAAADIFASLIDNYQESFGLTPIEGMAAGLPCVISDWDGYRDGVRHAIDGFLIPTAAPGVGNGIDLAYHFYNGGLVYSEYLAAASQSVMVDIDSTVAAFVLLGSDPKKRQQMGAAGRKRAQDVYDWQHIIPQYEALWDQMYEKRKQFYKPPFPRPWTAVHRAFPDPYAMFDSFPSITLKKDQSLILTASAEDVEKLLQHRMNYYATGFLLPIPEIIRLMTHVGQNHGCTIGELMKLMDDSLMIHCNRSVGWMLKNGFLAYATPLKPKDHQAA